MTKTKAPRNCIAVVAALTFNLAVCAQSADNMGALRQYSEFYGVNESCKPIGVDHSNKLREFLGSKLALMKSIQSDKSAPAAVHKELAKVIKRTESGEPIPEIVKSVVEAGLDRKDLPEICERLPQHIDQVIAQDQMIMELRTATAQAQKRK